MKERIKGIKDEWYQYAVIHCPDNECKGMLLSNPYYHQMKCSNCGKLFIEICYFKEVKEIN